ncbi:MAG TPA: radical SAM family heme chaperone HemW [Bacteroidota bacterium]|nr:radical SAM family heme chaperone HemW [Bacteroidota bacterium]
MPGLYLHIPYCDHKCLYCDFYSIESLGTMDDFLPALRREIGMYGESHGRGSEPPSDQVFDSIFFGGGTPSLLDPGVVGELISALREHFTVTDHAEVTLETNPGTVDRAKLKGMLDAGVNRLSVGIQSFHEDELKFLTRIHDAETARRCVRDAFDAGFTNLNIDLIFALPRQTAEKWEQTLSGALELSPQHISAYCLIYEEGTPLIRLLRSKQVTPLPGEDEAVFYEHTMKRLGEAGYEQYEVSNFALPGFRCRHNLTYWEHREYIGFGPSAHSFRSPRRWWNVANISTYLARLSAGRLPVAGEETLGGRELFEEKVMLGLRTGRLDLDTIRRDTGNDILATSRRLIAELRARNLADLESGTLRLSRGGIMVCDEVSARIIADSHQA